MSKSHNADSGIDIDPDGTPARPYPRRRQCPTKRQTTDPLSFAPHSLTTDMLECAIIHRPAVSSTWADPEGLRAAALHFVVSAPMHPRRSSQSLRAGRLGQDWQINVLAHFPRRLEREHPAPGDVWMASGRKFVNGLGGQRTRLGYAPPVGRWVWQRWKSTASSVSSVGLAREHVWPDWIGRRLPQRGYIRTARLARSGRTIIVTSTAQPSITSCRSTGWGRRKGSAGNAGRPQWLQRPL